jgi:NAD(P) transhydrogenase subunit alpha
VAASVTDAAHAAAGAEIVDRATAFGSELVPGRSPSPEELKGMKSGTGLVGMLNPSDRPGQAWPPLA